MGGGMNCAAARGLCLVHCYGGRNGLLALDIGDDAVVVLAMVNWMFMIPK